MTLEQMLKRRAELLDRRKELHELAEKEGREFTEDEQKEFDAAGVEAEQLKGTIARARQIGAEQGELDNESGRLSQPDLPRRNAVTADHIEIGAPRLAQDPTGGYGECGFGQFAQDIFRSRTGTSDRLRAWHTAYLAAGDGMNTFIGADGGYLIPAQFGALVDRIALEQAVVRPRATVIPMQSPRLSFPIVDDTSHASSVFGGVIAYFKSEESQLTATKPATANVELDLHKLTAMAYVSNEMLDWSPISLDSWLPQKLAEAIAWKEDDKFINGLGAGGEPIGIINTPGIISIAKETGQAAATFLFENLVKMDAQLWAPGGVGNIVWIANQTVKPQLAQLAHLGEGQHSTPLFLPGNSVAGRPGNTLYGYPIVFTEKAAALGTTGDIMLANLSQYIIGDGAKTRTDRDMGLKFDYDQTAFRVVTYTGGLCPWRSAFTPANGDTLHPVVKLDARA